MRIAQVAPLYESVPPRLYGGTERVIAHLTSELVALGHDVTLFASGDSNTDAKLVRVCERALWLDERPGDETALHILLLERLMQQAGEFDLIHFHLNCLQFLIARRLATPHVSTLHGRLDLPDMQPLYAEFSDVPLCSISRSQRSALPNATWYGTVHHGLPLDLYEPRLRGGDYFAFLGRLSRDKRVDRAIAIAKRLQIPLRIAAKIDPAEERYFHEEIVPLLDDPLVDYVGEIDESQKGAFLGGARALLFPIDWPEPFGLVVIEALACATPVVAFGCGAVPELIDDGVTGYVVHDLEQAVAAAARVHLLDRRACRAVFERRFSSARMAEGYLGVYAEAIERAHQRGRRALRAREAAA